MAFVQMEIASKEISPRWMAVLAFLIPLLFALYTGHAWEDYYITYRASHNLATGHGLVYTPGERVQSFTSPLGTLLPALCAWITGGNHDDAALWLYRLICCSFLAGAAFLLARLCNHWHLSARGTTVLFGLFLTSAKIIDFTINGMESALMIFFVVWCLVGFFEPKHSTIWWLGLGFAGLMWTRPDAFIPGGALLAAWLIFGTRPPGSMRWKQKLPLVTRAVLLAALFYAPWFIWAWWYYGSPIPQTIIAKGAMLSSQSVPHKLISYLIALCTGNAWWTARLFSPSYDFIGGWPDGLQWLSEALSLVAMFYWLWPKARLGGRIASFALFLGGFYLTIIPLCPWYFPVWELLAFVALAFLVEDAATFLAGFSQSWMLSGLHIAVTTLLIVFAGILLCTARQFRIQEAYIERGGREQIGLWLRAHSSPGDTVFLEPLGYIGYYSGLKTYDTPGLSSPEVVAVRKTGHPGYEGIIRALRPTWLVLRPWEVNRLSSKSHLLDYEYLPVRSFSCYEQICATPFIPGRSLLIFDACFIIFRRQDMTTKKPVH